MGSTTQPQLYIDPRSASTATPASRRARSTRASPRTSCPDEWQNYIQINAGYYER